MKKMATLLLALGLATQAHASCFVLGDSIAQGTAANLPACQSNTKVGLNTLDALTRFSTLPATPTTVISLGINDGGTPIPTRRNLEVIRARVKSSHVVWILPSHADKKAVVEAVATAHHDKTMDVDRLISSDGIHPTWNGYKVIASQISADYKLQ
ncbi:MAG TPA: SGNH/GDSL hydrolase family protein [Anaerovoracaceae bacterium]|nr:SGNH/GDSL hydrolase family protein [Anaerovoracaceae bacterium]